MVFSKNSVIGILESVIQAIILLNAWKNSPFLTCVGLVVIFFFGVWLYIMLINNGTSKF